MNGYICLYNQKSVEVYAETLYQAKVKAVELLKTPKNKQHMVTVMLAEKDGEQVTHSSASL
jgi:hypothetical protein